MKVLYSVSHSIKILSDIFCSFWDIGPGFQNVIIVAISQGMIPGQIKSKLSLGSSSVFSKVEHYSLAHFKK